MELDQLIKQLSSDTRDIFESAVGLAANRSHFDVDIAHWLLAALNTEHQDMSVALQATNPDKLRVSLDQWMESRQTGCDGYPKIHHDLVRLLFDAWMLASSEFQALQVRPAHMLLAMVEGQAIRARLQRIHPGWSALTGQPLRQWLTETQVNPAPTLGTSNQGSALARFTQNLSALVQAGKIDAVVGRNEEVRQMIDVLARHKQNNPILVGEAGVGKTAVVEGLAVQIANGQVPTSLQNVALHSVDLGLLQAGASVKGEFENRLKNLIKEVQTSPTPIVLFIDEAHTLIGAGQAAGQGDAANLLKPALARGELRTIAATTWSEYKQYIENDAALTRRFQVIQIDEPDEQRAIMMLGSLVERLQKHHEVRILHEAVVAAVALSKRYLNGRQLPDKCVSVLDTACARVNLSLQAIPASLERLQSEQNQLIAQFKRLQNEVAQGFALSSSLTTLKEQKNDVENKLKLKPSAGKRRKPFCANLENCAAAWKATPSAKQTAKPS
ncbi:MAG: AAA family ATPase [Limnobacter sp.]|nr:AAA family ATPase [Limnobacter sp.]